MKRLLLLSCLTVFLQVLFSCGGAVSSDTNRADSISGEKAITVTDSRGETVVLPPAVKTIATFPAPHPHIIVYLDGNASRIKGLHPLARKAAEVSIISKMAPGLTGIDDNFLTGSLLNAEELLKLKPDVFFTDQLLQGMEKLTEAGLPVIYLGLEKETINLMGQERGIFSPEKSIKQWVEITAKALGKDTGKADEIFREWEDVRKEIGEKTSGIPFAEKKKVLIVFRATGNMVAGGNSFGQYWITSTGSINAAQDITGNHPAMVKLADFEQILRWNPDIVYLTNFEETMPDDIYNNRIPGQDWSGTNAYRDRKVYKIPLGTYRWYPPSLDGPLMLKWMALKNYPEIFDWNMEAEIRKYYKKYFNYKPSDDEIEKVLNPAGSGNF